MPENVPNEVRTRKDLQCPKIPKLTLLIEALQVDGGTFREERLPAECSALAIAHVEKP